MSFNQPGLHVLFGAYNSGKSTLIKQAIMDKPSLVFDLELSGWSALNEANDNLTVLRYAPPVDNLTAMFDKKNEVKAIDHDIRVFDWILESLDEHAPGKKAIVFDTGIALENGLKDKIAKSPSLFGWTDQGGNLEADIFRPAYKSIFQHLFVNVGIEQIFMVFQLRAPWVKRIEPGEKAKFVAGDDLDLQGRIGIYRQEASSIVWLVPGRWQKSYGIVIKERSGDDCRIIPPKILEFTYDKLNNDFWEDDNNQHLRADLSQADVEMIRKFGERDRVQEAWFSKFMPEPIEPEIIHPITNHTQEVIFPLTNQQKAKALIAEGKDEFEIAEELGISLKEAKGYV